MHIRVDDDSELLDQVRSGHQRAYAQLVDRYKNRALTVALRMLGNRQEAEEMVQDAFVNAYRGLDKFRGDARFSTWFYRILVNLCLTRVTRRKRNTASLDEEAETSPGLLEDGGHSAHEDLERTELNGIVSREIDRLPQKLRTIILLFYIEEMSYEQISDVMNTPLGTVKTHLHRGRKLLREKIMTATRNEVGEQ